MLELTFGRPGKDQQIAAIQDLALSDFVFSADDINILTACQSDETEDLLRSLIESGCLSMIHIGPRIFYSRRISIDSEILIEMDGHKDYYSAKQTENEVLHLQMKLQQMTAVLGQKEVELEQLDELIEKWNNATIKIFEAIKGNWSQPLRLEQLAEQAGFNPDDLDIDLEELEDMASVQGDFSEYDIC